MELSLLFCCVRISSYCDVTYLLLIEFPYQFYLLMPQLPHFLSQYGALVNLMFEMRHYLIALIAFSNCSKLTL